MGPLDGFKVIEFAGIGPGPFCAMLLADMGADIIRIERKGPANPLASEKSILHRGRRSIAMNLKAPEAVETCLHLIEGADALIEGFRPGVMERLGLGPDICLTRNPKLVFGRMTGWGQTGPLANVAGHDINYISLSGALHAIGEAGGKPVPPLNLVGDFGGGSLYLALGVVSALLETQRSGKGQVVDAAMTDGAASLMAMFYSLRAEDDPYDERGSNLLDGGAPFYGTYETKDGKWISIGSLEPQFYALLQEQLGFEVGKDDDQMNEDQWPALKQKLKKAFLTKTRDEWADIMEGTDVCFAPILNMEEAPHHPHNVARETFITRDGVVQPAPAPRFSRTPSEVQSSPAPIGQHTQEILHEAGFDEAGIAALKKAGAI